MNCDSPVGGPLGWKGYKLPQLDALLLDPAELDTTELDPAELDPDELNSVELTFLFNIENKY